MQSPVQTPDTEREAVPHRPQLASLGWAMRRVVLWLTIMVVIVVLGAWLFYASIDLDEASAADVSSPPESAAATR